MERFVFIAAVTFAVIFAIVATFGHGSIHFDFDDGEGGTAELVAAAPGRMAATAFTGDELVIRHTAARIVITPEDRTDFSVEIDNPGRAPMPEVSIEDGDVRIDGHLRGRVEDCWAGGGADLEGYGEFTLAELPQITIRAPRSPKVRIGSGSTTEIGDSETLELDLTGCGSVTAGAITGALDVDIAGSGTVTAGAARSLNADIAGSGDLTTGAVAESANIDIAGSGTATIASLSGSLETDGLGSGDVIIQGGALTTASIDLAGSGNVQIAAPVESLTASIVGSGDVDVAAAVGNLDADVAGSGSVSVRAVTGTLQKDVRGTGEVRVGG
jgi:Putative auto-transporter adhesin, head GIN domain